ncbi:MAG: DNA methyltransferase [Pseudonocardiaceae bacterium]
MRDAANRSWTYLRGAWRDWREHAAAQPPGSPGTGPARERWLLVLLRELGYGQLPALRGGIDVDGAEYPVSHAWQHVPVHLLGPGVALDRRNPGVAGAARAPQAMVQELLNRTDEHLWALLSNGTALRLLRDTTALAGSAYVEFDLEAIFDGELFAEFLLLWQVCHVSRLEKRGGTEVPAADCWLEAWRDEAVDSGTRALKDLRVGVQQALVALGSGFLRHPDNGWLVESLRSGALSRQDYHRALLRLAYRLLFLSVAEDRGVLLHEATPQAADRYARYFSVGRLRRLSRVRAGGPHGDLWQGLRVVFHALGGDGLPALGLPALAGLFDPNDEPLDEPGGTKVDHLLGCSLANADLLTAMRSLGWIVGRGDRVQPVDYRNLGSEELGSVYESLLELVPRLDIDEHTFELAEVAGNERKTTGSYYTPSNLVSALLDSALDPLLDDAVKNSRDADDAVARLLRLTVCDPACGSGHFLVAAARRIARRVAQLQSGEDEPTPHEVQHWLREVVGHCIYGVDANPFAAELAKVCCGWRRWNPASRSAFWTPASGWATACSVLPPRCWRERCRTRRSRSSKATTRRSPPRLGSGTKPSAAASTGSRRSSWSSRTPSWRSTASRCSHSPTGSRPCASRPTHGSNTCPRTSSSSSNAPRPTRGARRSSGTSLLTACRHPPPVSSAGSSPHRAGWTPGCAPR